MNDDELRLESESFPYDNYLTVRGLLRTHYGLEHGDEIYELLLRTAKDASVASGNATLPGILFSEDGGEFVGLKSD